MDYNEITKLIEPQTVNADKIIESEKELEEQLSTTSKHAFEDRGTLYYYLIRLKLHKNSLLEDEKLKHYLRKMTWNFRRHEEQTVKNLKDPSTEEVMKNITRLQLNAFYKLVQSYCNKLEREFDRRGFEERKDEVYLARMRIKESSFIFAKKYSRKVIYTVWRWTSNYGESFVRWGVTNLIAVLALSSLFYLIGSIESPTHPMLEANATISPVTFFNYVYYSIITFTTVGYGDISPITVIERALGMIQALMGYLLLGIFLTLLQRKM